MTRDEIYDHLAQVYLGKRDKAEGKRKKKKPQASAWLVINIVIMVVILVSAFYGLTAFLTKRGESRNGIIYALTNGPVRIAYDLREPFPQVKTFSLSVPQTNASKYNQLSFSIRGLEEGYPGVVKVVLRNQKKESASFFIKDVRLRWKEINIPFEEFGAISDWSEVTDVSFVFEAWNAERKKGVVLIENICFSN